jgi:hypothetical protein
MPSERYAEPVASLQRVHRDADVTLLTLQVDRDLTAPLWPGALYRPDAPTAEVIQLHRLVRHDGRMLTFETYDWDGPLPRPGEAFILRLWWIPEAIDLVCDTARVWTREMYPHHDQCDWCPFTWTRFSADARDIGYEREGYRSGDVWISVEGYERYIRDDRLRVQGKYEH